jgi:arylsulfatase A-like enzyme
MKDSLRLLRMNVIEIVCDTFRREFLGCYGNDWIHTEHLDSFAEKAVVFDRAYIASFPTIPNRHDLFTGRYTFIYSGWESLPKDEVILAETLRQAGYTTMLIIDTYHMIRDGHRFDRGFDGWWWIRGQEHDRYMTNPTGDPVEKQRAFGVQYLKNISLRRFESDYFVAQTATAATRWLELNYDRHEKFFLHIDMFDPHEPWDPPKWYTEMYDPEWKGGYVMGGAYLSPYEMPFPRLAPKLSEEELKHLRALYAGEVTLVDRWVGMLLQKVEDLGLYEDTMVIFTTDHGSYHGEHGYIGKRPQLYEEVAHIPLIIRMPDSEGVKGRRDAIVQPPDLMPTILDFAGVEVPKTVQGRSLIPLMRDEEFKEREFAVSTAPLIKRGGGPAKRITITTKEWAFIDVRPDVTGTDELGRRIEPELYNLKKDPNQTRNLYEEHKDVAEDLHSKMLKFLRDMGASEEIIGMWRLCRSREP